MTRKMKKVEIQLRLQIQIFDLKMHARQTTRINMLWRTRNFQKNQVKISLKIIVLWLGENLGPNMESLKKHYTNDQNRPPWRPFGPP